MPKERKIAVGIGELLWDMLPAGKQLGGAPFNFARHCAQLGLEAYPVSRVGRDELGDELVVLMESWNVDTSHVARDSLHPTGTVDVILDDNGKPTYEIHKGVAWDYITMSDALHSLAPKVDAVCFGSLAQRRACSRHTILTFLDEMRPDAIKLFDVNIRQQYYTFLTIRESLRRATVLKLSDEELPVLAEMFSLKGLIQDQLNALREMFDLKLVAYTRGPAGSLLLDDSSADDHPGIAIPGKDTIGAGDSFSATICVGLLSGLHIDQINENANQVATFVCSQSGATPDLPAELVESVTRPSLMSS
ncbi:MAG: carbohydrate kinase [Puniceicoccaceae bacterium]